MNPLTRMLRDARAGLRRIDAHSYDEVVAAGALVVDIRPVEVREEQGPLPGAIVVGLNVLEWRLAPSSDHRIVDVEPDRVVLLVCRQGYSSSLAAARLQQLGLTGATDLVGGYEALAIHRGGGVA